MVLGLSLPVFALLHVIISLVGIFAGLVVVGGFMSGKLLRGWTGLFLVTTILTNVTGFFFPFAKLLPSHILGAASLVLLPVALFALYGKHLEGGWRKTFVILSVVTLYFNCFVLVVQLFSKFPLLIATAPDPEGTAVRHHAPHRPGHLRLARTGGGEGLGRSVR